MSINKTRASAIYLNQLVTNIPIRRKLTEQSVREKFEWSQWQSATKAVNNVESVAKEKHVRNLILGTFRLEGARLFWSMMGRINVESHPIICYKFCYVLHRLLRDGHKHVIHDCILLTIYFEQLSKYWSGVRHSYAVLAKHYCNLLKLKLKFHEQNPIFLGNLTIDENSDIRRALNNDLNLYFQLCVELLDYMEEILNLVQHVFTSMDQSRANSMTSGGQCRLNPFLVCIQESSLLYDHIVKILFKLHEGLPNDVLQSHRQRLQDQFRRLRRFYAQSSTLEYLRSLIKIPSLPENPPDFNVNDDFKNYQSPVAVLNARISDPTSVTDNLIDISDDNKSISASMFNDGLFENGTMYNRVQASSDLEQKLVQYDAILTQNRSETDDLRRAIATKDAELVAERNYRLQIEEQLRHQLNNQKPMDDIHKANSDEKFNKLLDTYNQLRNEHIIVLRREGEVKKQFMDLNQQYTQLKEEYSRKQNEFDQNYEKLNNELIQLRQTNNELQNRVHGLTNERDDYQSITATTSQRLKQLEDDQSRFHNDKSVYEQKLQETEGIRRNLSDQKREQEEDLIDLIHEKEILEQKVIDLEEITRNWAQKYITIVDKQKLVQMNCENIANNLRRQYKYSILTYCINQMHDGIDRTKDIESLNCKSSVNYLLLKLQIAASSTKTIQEFLQNPNKSDETDGFPLLNECITLANCMADIVVHGKATAKVVQNSTLPNGCRDLTLYCINVYENYQSVSTSNQIDQQFSEFLQRLNSLIEKTKTFCA